ncbi:MAG: type II toxin-antitoxin system VapC family toxin [Gammaproteobacteria bacterium]|uniref:type II toxin-antitoxin system VapC family toxin n=1 Tax=Rhodoferax sp. TaxID=50421 RepID=UPI0017991F1A|nr:type II toxin-antitoxin system VapC family toxin [Rhodoferax sp.]MBU3900554.1 type II toxin-antitoxin system VapC family toxin [Gammaproteobacteria bacterium]MBA3057541.1 type II toxin-antitoxin system VapC family toxin [Rhodoferax sp.]MBU3996459.1 type II toxin-antitoxin system VapC family toxin [Gammaproteobacteria bacterium]MBU4079999.1 type II toxin-antitoxin system VapC family toxin [Gammaproteobacteria bacterium]MBU4113455.1 type II toxin-antitoxin system VapC family toxin [Gammaprote
MILIDTVVLSELRRAKPNAGVVAYLKSQDADAIFLSALTIGEIEAGIERQRGQNAQFAADLAQWLALIELQFSHCILPVTPAIAKLWGRLCVQTGNKGIDNLIAATALCHHLTVVTRNVKHFEPTGVRVFDPFGPVAKG